MRWLKWIFFNTWAEDAQFYTFYIRSNLPEMLVLIQTWNYLKFTRLSGMLSWGTEVCFSRIEIIAPYCG